MTVQYDGNDYYTIHIGNKALILHKSEIDEIQTYDFENNREIDSLEELQNKIEDLEMQNYEYRALIKNVLKQLEKGLEE